jgi:hypothetical protein
MICRQTQQKTPMVLRKWTSPVVLRRLTQKKTPMESRPRNGTVGPFTLPIRPFFLMIAQLTGAVRFTMFVMRGPGTGHQGDGIGMFGTGVL